MLVDRGGFDQLSWRIYGQRNDTSLVLNLTDAKNFEWWNVRGRPADDPVIDRYSSPGISLVASLGYDW